MQTNVSLDQSDARRIAVLCMREAARQGVGVAIAVVDHAGELLYLVRMDGARSYTVDLATRKARAAARTGIPTRLIEQSYRQRQAQPPASFGGPGGAPVLHDGACAGAVGVSGTREEIDERILDAGLHGWKRWRSIRDGS